MIVLKCNLIYKVPQSATRSGYIAEEAFMSLRRALSLEPSEFARVIRGYQHPKMDSTGRDGSTSPLVIGFSARRLYLGRAPEMVILNT